MAMTINTNVASLNAQRNLTSSQSSLTTSLQRLSSGLRINSAKDDAAGLAISERMNAQVKGLTVAARNANDGISLAQTAEGALSTIGDNLQRIRELAVQSANATNSASDRASLDAESSQLIQEITRVAGQTSFNGLNLLDGSFTSQSFQVGANANQTIDISSIADSRATALGSNILVAGGSAMGVFTAGAANAVTAETGMTLNTGNGGTTASFTYAAGADAKDIAAAINTNAASVGVTATASNSGTLSGLSVAGTVSFTLNGASISAVVSDPTDLTALVGAINGAQGTSGVTASFTNTSSKNSISLTTTDGRDIKLAAFSVTGGASTGTDSVSFSGQALTEGGTVAGVKTGSVSLASSKGAITVTGGNADVFNAATSTFSSIASVSLTTAASSQLTIATVDAALSQVNASRGALGAIQNRFTSTISNLATSSENISAAKGRITDADFATETANMTKAQILQQAGTAMLAQANSLPQSVLSLLK